MHFHTVPPVSLLSWTRCCCLPSLHCFLQQHLQLLDPHQWCIFQWEPAEPNCQQKTTFELGHQFLPRMLCQLPYLLPAINFTGPPGQTTGQKSGKQLTVQAAPAQRVVSEGTLLARSFWVAGPAWPNLWIFDHSPGSLIFHLRLLVWPPNRGSLGRCDLALWTLNSSGANKNSGGGENFIRASSEVATSAEWKGSGCFASCRNKKSICKGLPRRRCLVWVVVAVSLRIDNGTCFYTMSYRVKMVLLWGGPAPPAWIHPQGPRLTPDGDNISTARAWCLHVFLLP